MVTFRVNVPSAPSYTVDIDVDIYVDTDNNANTGAVDIGGVDYVIQLFRRRSASTSGTAPTSRAASAIRRPRR